MGICKIKHHRFTCTFHNKCHLSLLVTLPHNIFFILKCCQVSCCSSSCPAPNLFGVASLTLGLMFSVSIPCQASPFYVIPSFWQTYTSFLRPNTPSPSTHIHTYFNEFENFMRPIKFSR